jgi:hypothetical protein
MNTNTSVAKVKSLFDKLIASNETVKVEYRNGSFTGVHVEVTTITNNKYCRDELDIPDSIYRLLTSNMLAVLLSSFMEEFRKKALE